MLVMGVGLGLVFAPSFNMGTFGVAESEAGVASATIHVSQQIGGSIGTALLNSIATTVVTGYVTSHVASGPLGAVQAQAAIHSYSVVFWICAASFAFAAITVTALLHLHPRPGRTPALRPVLATNK
jgi:hypothetical protein